MLASSGWIGRYLDGLGAASDNFNAVAIGGNVPLHMAGRTTKATALPTNGNSLFGVNRRNASDARMFDAISSFGGATTQLGGWADTWAVSGRVAMAQAERVAPLYSPALPGGNLVRWVRRGALTLAPAPHSERAQRCTPSTMPGQTWSPG